MIAEKEKKLIGKTNVGYTIIHQEPQAVVGFNPTKNEYVVWSYVIGEDLKPTYFWGHYSNSIETAVKDLKKKR